MAYLNRLKSIEKITRRGVICKGKGVDDGDGKGRYSAGHGFLMAVTCYIGFSVVFKGSFKRHVLYRMLGTSRRKEEKERGRGREREGVTLGSIRGYFWKPH